MNHRKYAGRRYHLLDVLRGITLISMILYHASWDLVYIAGVNWPWYHSREAFYWQQSICWPFILLSGFCIPLSVHRWKRGLTVFAAGALVTGATIVFVPEDRVIFGVLTFIGSAMLIMAAAEPLFRRIPGLLGLILNGALFYVFRFVNSGYLQLLPGQRVNLPGSLYHGYLMTFLGFMDGSFWSTDYFSLLPWIFLFLCGYYLHRMLEREGALRSPVLGLDIPPLSYLGQHSLLIYLLHQPFLYMLVVLGMKILPAVAAG